MIYVVWKWNMVKTARLYARLCRYAFAAYNKPAHNALVALAKANNTELSGTNGKA